jgi:uncharacterized membrane protein
LSGIFLVLTTMLASGVEFVEALTIILATGLTRGWRSALIGAAAAVLVLAAVVAVLGISLARYIHIETLRLIVGVLLTIFGLQWLRKAVLRASGLKALHDEDAIFSQEVAELRAAGKTAAGPLDWVAFVVAFKAIFLEGLEVVFIVISFGASTGRLGLATLGAGAAAILVLLAGLLLHRPLARVPENAMKFCVGLLLFTFGTFWAGEGVGIEWRLGGAMLPDAMLPVLLAMYALASWVLVQVLRRRTALVPEEGPA